MTQLSNGKSDATLIIVALGSNAPPAGVSCEESVVKAISMLRTGPFRLRRQSALYQTPCFPDGAGPDYVNAVVLLESDLSPQDVLERLHSIEAAGARVRGERWGNRAIDLDLLAYGDLVVPDRETFQSWRALPAEEQTSRTPDGLILPHPRIQDRAFVLVPLCDVAPDWVHPILGRTAAQMLAALPPAARAAIRPLARAE
ncbi:MAG: 2-amino-4-hydroxy-6-hydroxymethyldihydropteridine diphosphokinase [Pseudomonadota bacterium]